MHTCDNMYDPECKDCVTGDTMYTPAFVCGECSIPIRHRGLCLKCNRLSTRICCECGIGTCDPFAIRCHKCLEPKPTTLSDVVMRSLYGDKASLSVDAVEKSLTACKPKEQPKPEPMTVDRAAEVLNRRNHNNCTNWYVVDRVPGSSRSGLCGSRYLGTNTIQMHPLWQLEGIAIAEWYERNPESK